MPPVQDRIEEFKREGWSFEIEEDGVIALVIKRKSQVKGRVAHIKDGRSREATIERLYERGIAWIEDYNTRQHTGSTGFGDLT